MNARGGYYGAILQAAVSLYLRAVVQLLLEHGADINARSGRFDTPLQAVVAQGYLQMAKRSY